MLSCKKASINDAFKRTGASVTEQRTLASIIKKISIYSAINVTVVPDSSTYITVTAGKNLLSKIITQVIAGELIIKNNNTFNWLRSYTIPINVTVHSTTLTRINVLGTGTVIINNNTCATDTVRLHGDLTSSIVHFYGSPKVMIVDISTGTGTYILQGNTNQLFAYTGAIGKIDAHNFTSNYTDFNNSGLADIYLNTQGDIYGQIHSLGNVYDHGTGTLRGLVADDRGTYNKQ